jgi:PKD repeat protein
MNPWTLRALSLLTLTAVLTSCGGGGGGGGDTSPPPPPPANTPPVAAFTAAASVAAGAPLMLDASGSSDANGDALTYSWDFGNGRRGGGQKIARIFDATGTVTVRLTVNDGRGGSNSAERQVNVTAGPAAVGSVSTLTIVRDAAGVLLSGVTVTSVRGGAGVPTGNDGRATVTTDRGVPVVLRLSKAGYADQIKVVALPAGAESGYLEATMQPREPALTLPSAAAGGTLTGKDGGRVTFGPNSLVDANGNPVTGAVQVSITPVDVAANPRAFPGRFAGLRTDGQQGLLLSYGTMEVILSAGGAPVQLAPGRSATIEIPIYARLTKTGRRLAAGDRFPMWSLDERTGGWIEEGQGTVVAASTPSDFALRGEVTHFSWWNHDDFEAPGGSVEPRCRIDTNLDGVAEDLTDTGYCWHMGSPSNPFPTTIAPAPLAGTERLQAEPRTERIPATVAEATLPVNGGTTVVIPSDLDILFRSYAKGGTLMGSRVVRVGAGAQQVVDVILYPVKQSEGTLPITLPYDDSFVQNTPGEVDRFTFAAEAGLQYEVTVTRAPSSLLDAFVSVSNGATQLTSGAVGTSGYTATVSSANAATLTVAVTAGANAPGSYRIQVRRLTNVACTAPTALALPSTTANVALPALATSCFTVALAADDVIEIGSTQPANARGTVRLLRDDGTEVDADTYGPATGGPDPILLRVAIATAGTYRIEIANTGTVNGTIGTLTLARITPAAVLNPGEEASFTVPAGSRPDAYYLLKAPAGANLAIVVEAGVQDQQLQIWPGSPVPATAIEQVLARVRAAPAASHTLVRVTRFASVTDGHSFRVVNRVPDAAQLDTDVNATLPAGQRAVRVVGLSGPFGSRYSLGLLAASGSPLPNGYLLSPSGTPVAAGPLANLFTLTEPGLYTLLLANFGQQAGSVTSRINTVPVEPVNLATPFERTTALALGQVLHLAPTVSQGQLLALALSTPAALDLRSASAGGAQDGALTAPLTLNLNTGPTPRSGFVGPVYATRTGPVGAFVQNRGQAGPVTINLGSPAPAPTALGATFTAATSPATYAALGYTLPAAGRHLVCLAYPLAASSGAGSQVALWGNGAQANLYAGEASSTLPSGSNGTEFFAVTRTAGAHVLTLRTAGSHTFSGRLLAVAAPAALTLGAAADGALDVPCARRYFSFAGTGGQTYTLRVTAAFAGTVYVRKQEASGDWTARSGGIFVGSIDVPGSPAPLAANTERVLTFTVPTTSTFGNGTYIVEVDGDGDVTGSFTLQLASP